MGVGPTVASVLPQRDELGLSDGLLLIDGEWRAALDGHVWQHTHPATGETVGSFPVAGPADVDLAVRAAHRALEEGPWPRARAGERMRVLRTIADLVRMHGDELLRPQALDNSVPLTFGSVYATSSASSRTSSTTTPAGSTSLAARRSRPTRAATTW